MLDGNTGSPGPDRILLHDMRLRCVLGVYEWERRRRRPVTVSVTLLTDARPVGRSDDLAQGVDYEPAATGLRRLVGQSRRLTVEALAEDIAAYCLGLGGVRGAIVRVEKPGALRGVGRLAVEILRP